ncbi:DUF7010 family protein [Alicyclobacillus sp. ALC3]|uniref:DUF7010 family protein n=1 Tax=Alicyclobacillus sp. ALC3 TaxID=2796143 RepID=UPI003FCE6891
MDLEVWRSDISNRTKKGLSFIVASVFIWTAVCIVWLMPIQNVLSRNLLTFICTTILMPLSLLVSKLIGAEFSTIITPSVNW